ncbi:HotDog domain-containing protein [Xylaria digitata]|nr:HotDog domain-containing protein [Xylaria digitata]
MNDNAQSNNDGDEVIRSHIEHLVRTNLPHSPIYDFLLSEVRIVFAKKGTVKARLTLTRDHINSSGGLHGAVSAAITDWAGGMAIATWDLRAKTGVSVDIHVRYLSSACEGDEVEIEGTAEKVGGSIAFTRVVVSKVVDGVVGPVIASGTHTKFVKLRGPPN